MRTLLKKLVTLIFTYFVLVTLVTGFFYFFPDVWAPPALRFIETHLGDATQAKIHIERLRLVRIWPLTLGLEGIEFVGEGKTLASRVGAIRLSLAWLSRWNEWHWPQFGLNLEIDSPTVRLALAQAPSRSSEAGPSYVFQIKPPPAIEPGFIVADVALNLKVVDGAITVTRGEDSVERVQAINLSFSLPSVRAREIKPVLVASGDAYFVVGGSPNKLPWSIDLKGLVFDDKGARLSASSLTLANLVLDISGERTWADGHEEWKAVLHPTDLAKVPVPPSFLPAGKWQGSFAGDIVLRREKYIDPPSVSGAIRSADLIGEIDLELKGAKIKGLAKGNVQTRFAYTDRLKIDDFSLFADLTDAELVYGEWIRKDIRKPLTLDLVLDGSSEQLVVRRGILKVDPLTLEANGTVGLGSKTPSEIRFDLKPVALAGLEEWVPALAAAPLVGTVQASGKMSGRLAEPKSLIVELTPARLTNAKARVEYLAVDKSLKLSGPVAGDFSFDGVIKELKPTSGNLNWAVDMTTLEIEKPGVIRKAKGQSLKTLGNIGFSEKKVEFRTVSIRFSPGQLDFEGTLQDWAKPHLAVKATLLGVPVQALTGLVPGLKHQVAGKLDGKLNLTGIYDLEKGLEKSPLTLSGALNASLNQVVLAPHPNAEQKPNVEPSAVPVATSALLPNWPLFSRSRLKVNATIDEFKTSALAARKLALKANYEKGVVTGESSVGDVFHGMIKVNGYTLQLLDTIPSLSVRAGFTQLEMGDLVQWLAPSLKNFGAGQATGQVHLQGPLPTVDQWLKDFKVDGHLQVLKGVFNSWQLDQVVNEQLEKYKLKNSQGLKSDPVHFTLNSTFLFSELNLRLGGFDLLTARRDQLQADGTIGMNLTVDMKGTAYVASSGLGGSVLAANADRSGRLVLPVEIHGNLAKPSFHFADSTLKALAGRTLEYEKNKLVDKLKDSAKQGLEKDLKKHLKGLFK